MNPVLLMATTLAPGASEGSAEAEPVVLELNPLTVTLVLDTGERIVLDRSELQAAIAERTVGLRDAA